MRDTKGGALVEFAIIFPLMLYAGLGVVDLVLAAGQRGLLEFAAEAGARCAALGCAAPAAAAAQAAPLPGITAANFTVATATCGSRVDASYTAIAMVLPAIPLTATACYP